MKRQLKTVSELSELTGVRFGTIRFYSEIGILPFKQEAPRCRRYYNKEKAIKRLEEIKELKAQRLTIKEIQKHFKGVKE